MSGTIYDSNGTYDVAAALGTTDVTVTHDVGTPVGQVPVVTLNVTSLAATLNINSTNGAEAIVNPASGINLLGTLNYNANGGEILLGTNGSVLSGANATISNDGTFDVGGNTFSGYLGPALTVTYAAGGGLFVVDQATVSQFGLFTGGIDISGFGGAGDYIDDKAITFSSIKSYSISYNAGTGNEKITFKEGTGGSGNTAGSITVSGNVLQSGTFTANAGPLHLTNDGSGGTLLQCFLAGTAISTPDGVRSVETLAPGDLVLTAAGASRPVVWVGHRTIERASLRDADIHDPVVIAADAVAPGIPARDLRVTPDHAILIDDRLIPARLLVNGTTIRQEPIATYAYYHVELDVHDILLAEGLTVESYLDCADRGRFANAGVVALHAAPAADIDAAAVYAARGCRPLTLDAATVQPIWQALADRAASLGHAAADSAMTTDAGLHLLVAGRRVAPVAVDGKRAIFALPAGAASVAIVSRAARPSQISPWLDDRRRLGVKIERAVLRDGLAETDIAMDGPAARAGWHAAERAGRRLARWTDGRAELALPPVAGPATLELTIAPLPAYPAGDLAIAA